MVYVVFKNIQKLWIVVIESALSLYDTCIIMTTTFKIQLTVYNYNGGPCYRCLYPKPPPPETVTNCSDGGVLGVSKYH